MRYFWTAVVCAAFVAASPPLDARGPGSGSSNSHASGSHSGGSHSSNITHSSSHSPSKSSSHSSSSSRNSPYATGAKRDSHGKIARSEKAKDHFKKQQPCPSTGKTHGACPGYVVDHVVPLKRGGADAPSNMQWQTTEAAKIKDRTE